MKNDKKILPKMKNDKKNLKQNYENAVNAYMNAFCNMYGFEYESDCWTAGDVGGVAEVADYFFSFDDIRLCVDGEIPFYKLVSWYEYCLDAGTYGVTCPNLKRWMEGCPRLSEKEMNEIKEAHVRAEEARDALKKLIEEHKRQSQCR